MKDIKSIEDVRKNIKGFVFGQLNSFCSPPLKENFRPGKKMYEWCKTIQKPQPDEYPVCHPSTDLNVEDVFNNTLPGVYISGVFGKNRSVLGRSMNEGIPMKDFFELVMFNSTDEDVKYVGSSSNLLDRTGSMKGKVSESAAETSSNYSPHAVKRWRRDYKIEGTDVWCLLLITKNMDQAVGIEKYLHNKNKDTYGHQHMLHEYTNNKSSKGYDKFSFERWLETREGEEGMEELAKWMPKMVEKFEDLRHIQLMEKYGPIEKFVK